MYFARKMAHLDGRSCVFLLRHKECSARRGVKRRDRGFEPPAYTFSESHGEPPAHCAAAAVKTKYSGHVYFKVTQMGLLNGILNKKPANPDGMEKFLGLKSK